MVCFTYNLMQNLMSLVLVPKATESALKIAQTILCLKNVYIRFSGAKGYI